MVINKFMHGAKPINLCMFFLIIIVHFINSNSSNTCGCITENMKTS